MVSDAIQCTTRSPTTPIGAGAPRSVRASTRARPSVSATTMPVRLTTPGAPSASTGDTSSAAASPAAPLRRGNAPTSATGTNGATASRCGREPAGTAASGTPTAATSATAATARNGVSRNAKSAVPERETRRAEPLNPPGVAALRGSAAATAASPAASAGHAPSAPDAPHPRARAPRRRRPRDLPQPPPTVLWSRAARPRPPIVMASSAARPDGSEDRESARQHRDPRRYRDRRGPRPDHLDARPRVRRQLGHRSRAEEHGAPVCPPPRQRRRGGRHRCERRGVATSSIAHRRRAGSGVLIASSPRKAARSASHPVHPPSSTAARDRQGAMQRRATAGLRWCSVTGDLSTTGAAPSVFPALEALLPRVAKPVQYVGGELNARSRSGTARSVRWALMYPDAYEVGLPNQGIQILYEVLNERRRRARRAHLRGLAGPRGADARARGARSSPWTRTARSGPSTCSGSASPPSSATPTCSPRSTWPGSRCTPTTAPRTHPWSSPGGTPRSTRNRSPTSSTPRCSATARRPSLEITEVVRDWKAAGRPGGRDELLLRLARRRRATCRASTTSTTCPTGAIAGSCRTDPGVPLRVHKRTTMDLDAWPYPKQPLVPMAETVHERASVEIFRGCTRGCRFCQAGMITRPVRERSHHRHRRDGRQRGAARPGSTRSGCCRCPPPTTRRSPRSPRAWPTATRAPTPSLSLPSTRVDAFNIDLANEISPQRPSLRADVRPRGRIGADPPGDQQDGVRGRPHPHRLHRLRPAAGARSSSTSCAACPPRLTRTSGDRATWRTSHPGRPGGVRAQRHPVHDLHRRLRAQAAHPVPVGGPGAPRRRRPAARKLRAAINADRKLGRKSAMRYHDGQPVADRGPALPR